MIDVLVAQADHLKAAKQLEQARDWYERACRLAPHRAVLWLKLADVCYGLGQVSECLRALEYVLRLEPRHAEALLLASAALIDAGNYEKAVQVANQALELDSSSRKAVLLNKSTALLRLGRNEEALATADVVLDLDPGQITAHSNRGSALFGLGRYQEALNAFEGVLALRPTHTVALANRVLTLRALQRPKEALVAATAVLQAQPGSPTVLLNRAAILLELGESAQALADLEHILVRQPDHPKALLNKSITLLRLGQNEAALVTADQALSVAPTSRQALRVRLQALLALERYSEVLDAIATAVRAADPLDEEAGTLWIRALVGLRRTDEALVVVDQLLRADHIGVETIQTCADALLWCGYSDRALALVEQSLIAYPDSPRLLQDQVMILLSRGQRHAALQSAFRLRNLATADLLLESGLVIAGALNANGRFQEALAVLEDLSSGAQDHWQFHAKCGEALAGLQRFAEARISLTTAGHLAPRLLWVAYCNGLLYAGPTDALTPSITPEQIWASFEYWQLTHGDWADYQGRVDRLRNLIEGALDRGEPSPLPPFHTVFLPLSPELRSWIARRESERLSVAVADPAGANPRTGWNVEPAQRLKIGYLSADFREHPTAHLMCGLFGVHDRSRCEIYGYTLRGDDGSGYYQRIKGDSDHFIDLSHLDNVSASRRIQADGIHILVDLMVYTNYARPEIFARRSAPIQVNWLGYPGRGEADYLDYWLIDPIVAPSEPAAFHAEQPVYLPECYQVNDCGQEIAETGLRRPAQGLPEQGFVFCGFNQIQKLEPVIFAVWMRILERTPGSVLWLYTDDQEVRARLRATAATHGVSGERLIFAEYLPKPRHLERCQLADLFLDTRLCNAHTTASDALWVGLPVLTCIGETFPARVAASLLHAVEMPELIMHSLEEYEEQAVRLATHPDELATLREKLAGNRLRTPLFDTARFARHLERAYEMMWEHHVQGLPPAPLWVAPLPSTQTRCRP